MFSYSKDNENNKMNLKKNITNNCRTPLISGAISLVLLTASTSSYAEIATKEQCAGVVRAGLNDCASSEHACSGMNTENNYESDWLWVPSGTCHKIAGSHVIGTNQAEE